MGIMKQGIRVRMIKNDVMAFGPTIIEAGREIVLPVSVALDFINRGTAEYINREELKWE